MKPWNQPGGCTFGRFMDEVLWGKAGYYAQRVEIGLDGADFYTSASFPLFGATLANYVLEATWRTKSDVIHVVEIGPGEGTFIISLVARLMMKVDSTTRVAITLIEPSGALRDRQRQRVEAWMAGLRNEERTRVEWFWQNGYEAIASDLIVLANEVLDALPVECVRRTPSGWLQAYIHGNASGKLTRTWLPASAEVAEACRRWLPIPVGSEAEICLWYSSFLRNVLNLGDRVRLVCMDYGINTAEWADGIRPHGTVRSYFKHQLVDVLDFAGQADITADVHWDMVRDAAASLGAQVAPLQMQREFLFKLDILNVLQEMQTGSTIHGSEDIRSLQFGPQTSTARKWTNQFKQLIMPGAMGERFSVLECVKE